MRLTIELIPKTSWNNNLRSYLTQRQWDVVRRKCYAEAGNKCEICGDVGPRHPVECHERWDFIDGKVKLLGLIALCPNCHEVKHVGLAGIRGRAHHAKAHFMKVNNMSSHDADIYIAEAFNLWRERSNQQWDLEISYLEEYMGEKFVQELS